jgi:PAS domain S-box-containing protein
MTVMGRHTTGWGTAAALLAGALFLGYLVLRGPLPDSLPARLELAGLAAVLAGAAALLTAHYNRQASDNRKYQDHAVEEELRAPLGPPPTEEGKSYSAIQPAVALPGQLQPRLIARLTPDLNWVSASPALEQFLGTPSAKLVGRPFLLGIATEDVPQLKRAFQEAQDTGEVHNVIVRCRAAGDVLRHVQMDVMMRYTETGAPLHLRCHLLDVTDRVRVELEVRARAHQLFQENNRLRRVKEDLERLKESYADLYQFAPVVYFSLDARGDLVALNETLLQTLGYRREELLNQPYARVLTPEASNQFLRDPSAYQQRGEVETQWVCKDGRQLDVRILVMPSRDAEGQFVRSRNAAFDLTERNRLAQDLRVRTQELEHLRLELSRPNGEPLARQEDAEDAPPVYMG